MFCICLNKLNQGKKIVGVNEAIHDMESDIKRKVLNQNGGIFSKEKAVFNIKYRCPVKDKRFDLIAELDRLSYNHVLNEGKNILL